MGADFLRKLRELLLKAVAASDVAIIAMQPSSRKAPKPVTADMVSAMPAGSVIVDLSAERGGNCELTQPGQTLQTHGVTILGPLNLPSEVPRHASLMFSNNLVAFLKSMIKEGKLSLKVADEIIIGTLLTRSGKIVHAGFREQCGLPPLDQELRGEQPTAATSTPPPESAGDTYRLADS
jgi:NAD(P) transhydrogenase subunit alpha